MEDFIINKLSNIISRVKTTLIFSDKDLGDYLSFWLSQTGTFPEIITSKSMLYDCDVVFSPNGLVGFTGKLFGKGGTQPTIYDVELPPFCDFAIKSGIDAIDLAALLYQNRDNHIKSYT